MAITQGSQRIGTVDDTRRSTPAAGDVPVGAVRIDEGLQVTPGVSPTGTPRNAMQRRADAAVASGDEDRIVRQIEETRADLAATIEELADRLSPKNVADRTKAQLTATAKEKVEAAKQAVSGLVVTARHAAVVAKDKAELAAEAAKERAASAAESAKDKAGSAADAAKDKVGSATDAAKDKVGLGSDDDTAAPFASGAATGAAADREEDGSVRITGAAAPAPRALTGGAVPAEPADSLTARLTGYAADARNLAALRPEVAVAGAVAAVLGVVWVVDRVRS